MKRILFITQVLIMLLTLAFVLMAFIFMFSYKPVASIYMLGLAFIGAIVMSFFKGG